MLTVSDRNKFLASTLVNLIKLIKGALPDYAHGQVLRWISVLAANLLHKEWVFPLSFSMGKSTPCADNNVDIS